MHLSMHNWMRAEPIKVTIARLAKYGYKSIEISGEPEQFGLNGSKDTKKLLDDYGLKCWGSVTLMLGERNLVAADPGQRAKSVQYTKDCITMVKELDGFEMTIVPATVGKIVADATPD
ncbi:MAG: sugar phosphate isomerase/epimerase, partial [Actinobacteria bacterium]|nr:sugar phosphate isomerase/epimerase [Actinomycetota bacterium]